MGCGLRRIPVARSNACGACWHRLGGAKQVSYPGFKRGVAPETGAGPLGAPEAGQYRALAVR
eukprot:9621080-Alexandrium_andersonii.AAC.1